MKIELLFFDGCPHLPPTRARLEEAVARMIPGAEVQGVCVETEEQAQRLGFLGSPGVLVDGVDLEGSTSGSVGMTCRLYDGGGVPPTWLIEAALLRALRPQHLLFLCVANSARSQMAEGIARSLAQPEIRISSAGSAPTAVRAEARQVLAEVGIDIAHQRSKGLGDVDSSSVDAVVTLCAEQVCPVFAHPVTQLHWGLADPAVAEGDAETRLAAFRRTRDELLGRLRRLFA